MRTLVNVKNMKGKDSSEIMNGILNKVFVSAYGKNIQTVILTPIKNNKYCDLQVVVHYTVDKRKRGLEWKPWRDKNLRILGCDQSYVCTGLAIIEDKELLYFTSIAFEKNKTKKGKREILKQTIKMIETKYLPDKIVVERTRLFSRGFISPKTIIALGSLTTTIIDATNLDVYSVDTRSWKAKVIGKASASKKDTINWVKSKFDIEVNMDEADAIAIALYPFMKNPLLQKENN